MQSHIDSEWTEWDPQALLSGDIPMVLMVLNQPLITETKTFIKRNWKTAVLRIAVDGGALHLQELSDDQLTCIPDIITGDFDSISVNALNEFEKMGARITPTPDQDETDFTKALRVCSEALTEKKLMTGAVLVIARNGDRLDHVLGNLNTLYTATEIFQTPVFILGDNSLTWLLQEGKHKVHISKEMMNYHMGLIPLGEPCTNVTTTGLKWNLSNNHMQFGGLISICNRFDGSDVVTIDTDKKLIWTMEVGVK